jgi:general secretion pathway protein A
MYESYFGFSEAPFLLNPDPDFFFDSRGHSSALSYLKFGLYQAEGFIVITGDIGAGKTTLVRTLLSTIDHDKVVAAQLVSTQLEAGDLLRSTITAFGIPPHGQSKAELIATLEAYLTLLATQKKRAVLIVDEAQNLSRDAIEELRMLSNFQFGNQALLQSFLIGQPELRDMLLSRSLEQLRQRVIASYHLGPMDREETRRYIEHRLTKVGWSDNPGFDDDAFDEIYQWTTGIPRRINLLCNRVLLATFLSESHRITAADVARVAMEIRTEIGEPVGFGASAKPASAPQREPIDHQPLKPPDTRPGELSALSGSAPEADWSPAGAQMLMPAQGSMSMPALSGSMHGGSDSFLIVASTRAACIRVAAMQRAFTMRNDLPPLRFLVMQTPGRFELTGDWCEHMSLREPDIVLRLPQQSAAAQLADAIRQVDHVLREYRPAAVIVQEGDEGALATSLVAHRLGIPLVHLEAGLRGFDRSRPQEINAMMCDHLSEVLLTSEWVAHDNLSREGIPADRVQFVGNLLMDTIRAMLSQASPPKYTLRQFNHPQEIVKQRHGYGVVYLSNQGLGRDVEAMQELFAVFRSICRDLPLILVGNDATLAEIETHRLMEGLTPLQMVLLPIIPYFKMIGLVGTAACVFTDSMAVQEEATIMGVPCLTLHNHTERRITVEQGTNTAIGVNSSLLHRAVAEVIRGAGKKGRLPKFWDGLTGQRVADQLLAWWKQKQGHRHVVS